MSYLDRLAAALDAAGIDYDYEVGWQWLLIRGRVGIRRRPKTLTVYGGGRIALPTGGYVYESSHPFVLGIAIAVRVREEGGAG